MKFRQRAVAMLVGAVLALGLGGVAPMVASAAPLGPCDGAQRIVLTKNQYTYTAQNCFATSKKVRVTVWVNGTASQGKCVTLKAGAKTSVTGRPSGNLIDSVGGNWSWC